MLRDADELLGPAVAATLAALTLADEDAALVKLAERYAATIDAAGGRDAETRMLDAFGPKLLATLGALGATPAARARRRTGGGGNAGPNRLEALRDARKA